MTLLLGDCLEVMPTLEAGSVDAVVTDPPYGLEFMGKSWDRLGDVGTTSHSGPAARDDSNPFSRTRVAFYGSSNTRCRNCGKWKWGHTTGDSGGGGKKCECDAPDFPNPNRHQGMLMQDWHQRWATEAFRVAKPGAYLLAFGGTRTYHRLTCAIEDAGWIIRDCLVWAYASGFPKSRALLKPAWEPIVMARKPGPLRELAIDRCRIGWADDAERAEVNARSGPHSRFSTGTEHSVALGDKRPHAVEDKTHPAGRWPANVILTDPIFDGDTPGVVGGGPASDGGTPTDVRGRGGIWHDGDGVPAGPQYGDSGTYSRFFMLPRSAPLSGRMGTCERCGAPIAGLSASSDTRASDAGSAPSPASAPSASTTPLSGQLAFDAGSPSPSPATGTAPRRVPTPPDGKRASTANVEPFPELSTTVSDTNVIARGSLSEPTPGIASLSDQPARTAELPPTSTGITTTTASPLMCERCADDAIHGRTLPPPKLTGRAPLPVDGDDYTRFLILPKAARSEREPVLGGHGLPERMGGTLDGGEYVSEGRTASKNGRGPRVNVHPTVKSLDLMRHLVRLVTPTGGTCLDPFAGSGTTALACELEGFPWIAIEREPEYVAIIEARLNGTQRGLGLPA